MTVTAAEFERVAREAAQRISDLLNAQVSAVDEWGSLVATIRPNTTYPLNHETNGDEYYLRVPISLGGFRGELAVSAPNNGEVMSPRVAQSLVELIINQRLTSAHLQGQYEVKNKFIHDLLRGVLTNEADILREGQILGMDFTRPRAVILIDASSYILEDESSRNPSKEDAIAQRARWVITGIVRFFRLPSDAICAYIGEGEVAVLKASSTRDLKEWAGNNGQTVPPGPSWSDLAALKKAGAALLARLRRDTDATIDIGIGRYHPGILGLSRSYEDARAALSLGRRFHGQNAVHCLDELGMVAFVGISDEFTKVDLARHLLGPLDHEPELLETLEAFFKADCSPSLTAHRLCVHRNTLRYRLDKAALLTGLDARRFDDAVQIRLALLLRSLVKPDVCAPAQSEAPDDLHLYANA